MIHEETPRSGPVFAPVLDGWASWGRVFQSIESFTPLARRIFAAHGLPMCPLSPLTPGTHAVFRAGGYVVKIMAPAETGLPPDDRELLGLRHAAAAGTPAPPLFQRRSPMNRRTRTSRKSSVCWRIIRCLKSRPRYPGIKDKNVKTGYCTV